MAEHPDVALVRRGYDAFSTGDVATLSEIIAPDAVQYQPGSGALAGEHKGLPAILEFYGRLAAETDGSFRVQLDRLYTDGKGGWWPPTGPPRSGPAANWTPARR